jgi:hypothetical protein
LYPDVTLEEFKEQIGRIESDQNYELDMPNGAYGKYQILPGNWKMWAPKALGTDRKLAVASKDIDPMDWVPQPTPENQEIVAEWKMNQMFRQRGDWRRVAASWNGGASVGMHQPGEMYLGKDGKMHYYWRSGTLLYVNNACFGYVSAWDNVFHVSLGYPRTTRLTILPDLPVKT